jgi:hypothetical protein
MKQTTRQNVDRWMEEESQQRTLALKVIRKNDPWQGMSDEEIEDRREFIRYYLNKEFELLLLIPIKPRESGFWFESEEELKTSAFNTWDFQKMRGPFDKYGYRIKKVMEHVKDLALLHSCISQPEGRDNIRRRFGLVLNNEFRDQLLNLVKRYWKTYDEERRAELRYKIARINRHILECKAIWQNYSPWEEKPSC